MADIKISNLKIVGIELFADTENYLVELSEETLNSQGGIAFVPLVVASSEACGMAIGAGILLVRRLLR